MRDLLFSSTNMAAMTSRENLLFNQCHFSEIIGYIGLKFSEIARSVMHFNSEYFALGWLENDYHTKPCAYDPPIDYFNVNLTQKSEITWHRHNTSINSRLQQQQQHAESVLLFFWNILFQAFPFVRLHYEFCSVLVRKGSFIEFKQGQQQLQRKRHCKAGINIWFSTNISKDRFTVTHQKNKVETVQWNKLLENLGCCGRHIYKSPHQFSGLCGTPFLCIFAWNRHVGVAPPLCTNMAGRNPHEDLEFTLRWKPLLFAHEIKYMCINTSPNVLETLRLVRFIGIDILFQPNNFVSCCHARWQFGTSKCCIFETKTSWNSKLEDLGQSSSPPPNLLHVVHYGRTIRRQAQAQLSIRALISPWKRGWRKHKHKHNVQKFSFSLCLRLCLRSLASCENGTQHKQKRTCCVWPN